MQISIPSSFFLLLLCLSAALPLSSQNNDLIASVRQISDEDGLKYREVFCSHQDQRGFLWLGTQYGLVKFDGHDFTYFTKEKNGLSSNEIHQILEDETGVLWLISYDNWRLHLHVAAVSWVDSKNESTIDGQQLQADWDKKLQGQQPNRFASSIHHRINLFDQEQNYFSYVPGQGFSAQQTVPDIETDFHPTEHLYYTAKQNARLLEQSFFDAGFTDGMERIRTVGQKQFDASKILGKVAPGNYLVAEFGVSDAILNDWMPGIGQKPISLPFEVLDNTSFYSQVKYRPSDGSIWFGSRKDFFVFVPQTGKSINFKQDFPQYFWEKNINDIHFGTRDEVFVSTSNGFYIVKIQPNQFTHYLSKNPRQDRPSEWEGCRTLLHFGDTLLVNHRDYYSLFNLETGRTFDRRAARSSAPAIPLGRSILILETGQSIVRWWPKSGKRTEYLLENTLPWSWCMHACEDSTILIGSFNGVRTWKIGAPEIAVLEKKNGFDALDSSIVYQFFDLENGELLLATSNGIFQLDLEKGITARYCTTGTGKYHFPFDDVLHLHRSPNGTFWAATQGGGLIEWDRATSQTRQYTTDDGLPSDIIYGVYEDEEGMLWMPTYQGIAAFMPDHGLFRVFTTQDGLSHNEFNRISHCQAPDGRLFFGGLNGVNAFHPNDLKKEDRTETPPMVITSLKQFDERRFQLIDCTEAFHLNPSITIRPNNTYSTITLALLDYGNPDRIRYDFKLKGRDLDWRPMLGNTLELVGMSYGNHQLILRGRSLDNQYLPQIMVVPIEVLKPTYLKWWFIALGILCLAGVIFLFFKAKTYRLARQKAVLEIEVERRTSTILRQQQKLAEDQKKIEEQAAEIEMLGQVIRTSQMPLVDAEWLKKLEAIIQEKMPDRNFKAQELATAMLLSRSQFTRKLKALTGLTPGSWLQETRLQKAKELLENNSHDSIKAVAYAVGFNPSYFAEVYRKRFGKLPSEC